MAFWPKLSVASSGDQTLGRDCRRTVIMTYQHPLD